MADSYLTARHMELQQKITKNVQASYATISQILEFNSPKSLQDLVHDLSGEPAVLDILDGHPVLLLLLPVPHQVDDAGVDEGVRVREIGDPPFSDFTRNW